MMNKTVLMLSVSCMSFIAGADLCYAGFNPYDTPPVLNAAMLKSHVSTHTSHLMAAHLSSLEDIAKLTLSESSGLSLPENSGRAREGFTIPPSPALNRATSPLKGEGDRIKLAAACFVTDTSGCSGNEFANGDNEDDNGSVPPGGDDYDLDNDKRCIEEGYTMTSCSEGYEPYNYCPYDRTYFEKCVSSCPSDYVTCEEPYHGVGEACNGKYASCECTPCGAGYDYTTIPEGYVQDGEACLDCDGKTKYKIKPNPCDGYMDCGSMGGEAGAKTCLSGATTMYDNCKPCPNLGTLTSCPAPFTCTYEECSGLWYKTGCQSGYDWNANTQTCTQQCSPNYQYTCSGTGYAGGSGEACDGKYQSCTCADGYEWKNGACQEILKPEWGKCNGSAKNCNIGDILYSDGTCSSPQRISGKTPIAVVVYKSADGNCAQAMALKSIGEYEWGPTSDDIPTLTNFDNAENANYDLNSCLNTKKILAEGNKSKYPAAWAAHEYNTKGTEAGDWCLPAAGIFTSYYNNQQLVNIGMTNAEGTLIGTSSRNWSSSESSSSNAWGSYFSYDYGLTNYTYYGTANKHLSNDIRPVLEF